jgi:hypothetical protein
MSPPDHVHDERNYNAAMIQGILDDGRFRRPRLHRIKGNIINSTNSFEVYSACNVRTGNREGKSPLLHQREHLGVLYFLDSEVRLWNSGTAGLHDGATTRPIWLSVDG